MISFHGSRRVLNLPKAPTPLTVGRPDAGPLHAAQASAEGVEFESSTTAPGASASRPDRSMAGHRPVATRPQAAGPFVPLLLCALSLGAWLAFQAWQFGIDRQALQAAYAAQQQTVDGAGKLRASLDALAADTQRLAEAGNANARLLVEELKKRGVTINPAAGPGTR